jgi:hypothetical protein
MFFELSCKLAQLITQDGSSAPLFGSEIGAAGAEPKAEVLMAH